MGKKGAHSGLSPKDRSTNAMDKFIQRSERRKQYEERKPGRRKDKNILNITKTVRMNNDSEISIQVIRCGMMK